MGKYNFNNVIESNKMFTKLAKAEVALNNFMSYLGTNGADKALENFAETIKEIRDITTMSNCPAWRAWVLKRQIFVKNSIQALHCYITPEEWDSNSFNVAAMEEAAVVTEKLAAEQAALEKAMAKEAIKAAEQAEKTKVAEETEQAAKEAEQAAKEAEQAAKEAEQAAKEATKITTLIVKMLALKIKSKNSSYSRTIETRIKEAEKSAKAAKARKEAAKARKEAAKAAKAAAEAEKSANEKFVDSIKHGKEVAEQAATKADKQLQKTKEMLSHYVMWHNQNEAAKKADIENAKNKIDSLKNDMATADFMEKTKISKRVINLTEHLKEVTNNIFLGQKNFEKYSTVLKEDIVKAENAAKLAHEEADKANKDFEKTLPEIEAANKQLEEIGKKLSELEIEINNSDAAIEIATRAIDDLIKAIQIARTGNKILTDTLLAKRYAAVNNMFREPIEKAKTDLAIAKKEALALSKAIFVTNADYVRRQHFGATTEELKDLEINYWNKMKELKEKEIMIKFRRFALEQAESMLARRKSMKINQFAKKEEIIMANEIIREEIPETVWEEIPYADKENPDLQAKIKALRYDVKQIWDIGLEIAGSRFDNIEYDELHRITGTTFREKCWVPNNEYRTQTANEKFGNDDTSFSSTSRVAIREAIMHDAIAKALTSIECANGNKRLIEAYVKEVQKEIVSFIMELKPAQTFKSLTAIIADSDISNVSKLFARKFDAYIGFLTSGNPECFSQKEEEDAGTIIWYTVFHTVKLNKIGKPYKKAVSFNMAYNDEKSENKNTSLYRILKRHFNIEEVLKSDIVKNNRSIQMEWIYNKFNFIVNEDESIENIRDYISHGDLTEAEILFKEKMRYSLLKMSIAEAIEKINAYKGDTPASVYYDIDPKLVERVMSVLALNRMTKDVINNFEDFVRVYKSNRAEAIAYNVEKTKYSSKDANIQKYPEKDIWELAMIADQNKIERIGKEFTYDDLMSTDEFCNRLGWRFVRLFRLGNYFDNYLKEGYRIACNSEQTKALCSTFKQPFGFDDYKLAVNKLLITNNRMLAEQIAESKEMRQLLFKDIKIDQTISYNKLFDKMALILDKYAADGTPEAQTVAREWFEASEAERAIAQQAIEAAYLETETEHGIDEGFVKPEDILNLRHEDKDDFWRINDKFLSGIKADEPVGTKVYVDLNEVEGTGIMLSTGQKLIKYDKTWEEDSYCHSYDDDFNKVLEKCQKQSLQTFNEEQFKENFIKDLLDKRKENLSNSTRIFLLLAKRANLDSKIVSTYIALGREYEIGAVADYNPDTDQEGKTKLEKAIPIRPAEEINVLTASYIRGAKSELLDSGWPSDQVQSVIEVAMKAAKIAKEAKEYTPSWSTEDQLKLEEIVAAKKTVIAKRNEEINKSNFRNAIAEQLVPAINEALHLTDFYRYEVKGTDKNGKIQIITSGSVPECALARMDSIENKYSHMTEFTNVKFRIVDLEKDPAFKVYLPIDSIESAKNYEAIKKTIHDMLQDGYSPKVVAKIKLYIEQNGLADYIDKLLSGVDEFTMIENINCDFEQSEKASSLDATQAELEARAAEEAAKLEAAEEEAMANYEMDLDF